MGAWHQVNGLEFTGPNAPGHAEAPNGVITLAGSLGRARACRLVLV